MAASLSNSDLQIILMPTKCGGVQVDQTMTLMMSVLLVIESMWQINTESIAEAVSSWLSSQFRFQILREQDLLQILLPSKLRCVLRELELFQQFYLLNLMAPPPS